MSPLPCRRDERSYNSYADLWKRNFRRLTQIDHGHRRLTLVDDGQRHMADAVCRQTAVPRSQISIDRTQL